MQAGGAEQQAAPRGRGGGKEEKGEKGRRDRDGRDGHRPTFFQGASADGYGGAVTETAQAIRDKAQRRRLTAAAWPKAGGGGRAAATCCRRNAWARVWF